MLQGLLDQGHELIGDGAVYHPMVIAEGEVHNRANRDGVVAILVSYNKRRFGDAADAHDGGIGLVDDGKAEYRTELAGVGDGEGGAFDFLRHQLLGPGALAEISDSALETEEIQVVGILEDGN